MIFFSQQLSMHTHVFLLQQFRVNDAQQLFPRDLAVWVTMQGSDGREWAVKVNPNNTTHVMGSGYAVWKRDNNLTSSEFIKLRMVGPSRFVFEGEHLNA